MKTFEYGDFLRYLQEREEGIPKPVSAGTSIRELDMDSMETLEL